MPRHEFTAEQSATIEKMRDTDCASWYEIGRTLGVTVGTIRTEYNRISDCRFREARAHRIRPARRRCLGGCGDLFDSTGPGNRICDTCATRADASPFEPDAAPHRNLNLPECRLPWAMGPAGYAA